MARPQYDGYLKKTAEEFLRLQREYGFWEVGDKKWFFDFNRLKRTLIPEPHTECPVETRQNYADFTLDEIIHVLERMGDMANMLYPIEHTFNLSPFSDDLGLNDLQKEGIYELERIVWLVATFSGRLKRDPMGIDLVTRLKQIQERT